MTSRREFLVTSANYSSSSVDAYYLDFKRVWPDDAVERNALDIWLHVVDNASSLGRSLRATNPYPEIDRFTADTIVWLMSFIAQCGSSTNPVDQSFFFDQTPAQLLWERYPYTCPGCFDLWIIQLMEFQENDLQPYTKMSERKRFLEAAVRERALRREPLARCQCLDKPIWNTRLKEVISSLRTPLDCLRRMYADTLIEAGVQVSTWTDFEVMFDQLYVHVHDKLSLDAIALRVMEEIGEATHALQDCYTYDDLKAPYSAELHAARTKLLREELADVLSWIFSLRLKLRFLHEQPAATVWPPQSRIPQLLWNRYGTSRNGERWPQLRCPGCQNVPCGCQRVLRAAGTTGESTKAAGDGVRDRVFICYSHTDDRWCKELRKVLAPLRDAAGIIPWSDLDIQPGSNWRDEIESALARTKVGVLLVSPDFFASNFIEDNELPPLLEAARTNGARIVWIPVRASMYDVTSIDQFEAAHDPAYPIAGLSKSKREAAYVKIGNKIKEAMNS